MHRPRLALSLLMMTVASTARAQTEVCQSVAHHLWSDVATGPLREQTPLAQLTAAVPTAFKADASSAADGGLAKPDQSIADALIKDHAADAALAAKLRDIPPSEAVRFGTTSLWLLDRVDGTLGCHSAMVAAVPPGAAAHDVGMPGDPDPSNLCALSALTAVTVDGAPALWIEQSGAFSNSLEESTISIATLKDEAFAPPCTLTVAYAITDHATHAFCDGVDCVPLIKTAEILALRLRQQETAETMGAGVIATEADATAYHRMAEIVAADNQPAELPSFGVPLDTPYTTFADQMLFPTRLTDGAVYLVRLGHGGLGWRQTADTLLALYRMRDDRLVPAASVYVSARRTGIIGATVQ